MAGSTARRERCVPTTPCLRLYSRECLSMSAMTMPMMPGYRRASGDPSLPFQSRADSVASRSRSMGRMRPAPISIPMSARCWPDWAITRPTPMPSWRTLLCGRGLRPSNTSCRDPREPIDKRKMVSSPTLLADLVETSQHVGEHAARRTKIARIADSLRGLAPAEINIGVSYLAGATRQGKSGIGYAMIAAARSTANVEAPELTLTEVDATLEEISRAGGRGSIAERTRLLSALFARGTAPEQEFLARLLVGELRQGALEGLMIEAVAAAAGVPAETVRRAAMVAGGIASVAATALTQGAEGLSRYAIALFRPLAPMLAQSADDVADAMARIAVAALEWKVDGARVQVHKNGEDVRIYTRTGNDVTAAAPEIVSAVREANAKALILDGEAIALKTDGAPYPFQDTMRRFGRQLDIDAMRVTLPLSVFFFDCLRHDDQDLVPRPATERFAALTASL